MELKRDALFDVVRELGNIIEALTLLDSCYRARAESDNPDASPWLDRQSEALEAWSAASKSFSGATLLAELVCGPKLRAALGEANSATRRIAADVFQGNNDAFRKSIPLVLGVQHIVVQSIRRNCACIRSLLLNGPHSLRANLLLNVIELNKSGQQIGSA